MDDFIKRYDHDLLINVDINYLFCTPGEYIINIFGVVENLKDLISKRGQILVTNLRIIWFNTNNNLNNIVIGYNLINNFEKYNFSHSREKIIINCTFKKNNYEFIFLIKIGKVSFIKILKKCHRNYLNSFFLREYKLRSSINDDINLNLLLDEKLIYKLEGLISFSGNTGKTGIGYITNYRFIWISTVINSFNISVPLWAIPNTTLQKHKKYLNCFYIRILISSRNLLFGFTYNPIEILKNFIDILEKSRISCLNNPILTFPINFNLKNDLNIQFNSNEKIEKTEKTENFDLKDDLMNYISFNDSNNQLIDQINFNPFLGLSFENSKTFNNDINKKISMFSLNNFDYI